MKNILLLCTLVLLLPSCYKDKEVFTPNQVYTINNDILLSDLTGKPESLIANIDNQSVIVLPNDISLVLPKNKLNAINNAPVSGQIKIEFKDYTTPRSGLLNCFEPSTADEWIDNKKVIYLKISQDNQEINFTEPITIYLPTKAEIKDLKVYTQNTEGNNNQWNISSILSNQIMYGDWLIYDDILPSKEIAGYRLNMTQANNWILLGKPIGQKSVMDNPCTVQLPHGFNQTNSVVYFVSNENNFMFKLDYKDKSSQFYTNKGVEKQSIPGKMIFIGQISEDQYYFGTTNVVLGNESNVRIDGIAMPQEKIKAALSKL